jgi:membrane-associated HD superfamily phosphohydrolase
MKRTVPLMITFFTAFFLVVSFFIPHEPFGQLEQRLLVWFAIVSGFTMLLGVYSLFRAHVTKIARAREDRWHSLALLLSLVATLVVGIIGFVRFGSPFHMQSPFMFVYTYSIVPLQGTMFALLAFYIASASYRAFRARNTVATLLLVSAVIVMLGRVPIGAAISEFFPAAQEWIMDIPQLAAKRGIQIGAALGAVSMSLRIMLGIERSYLS